MAAAAAEASCLHFALSGGEVFFSPRSSKTWPEIDRGGRVGKAGTVEQDKAEQKEAKMRGRKSWFIFAGLESRAQRTCKGLAEHAHFVLS